MSLTLICMRLADMDVVHPNMTVRTCSKCGHEVGVYPSSMRAIEDHGGEPRATLMCYVCKPVSRPTPLPPGGLHEVFESVANDAHIKPSS